MISTKRYKRVMLSFMVHWHTKSAPGTLFAALATWFYESDISSTSELVRIIRKSARCHQLTEQDMCRWKGSLATKYSDISQITQYDYFLLEGHA